MRSVRLVPLLPRHHLPLAFRTERGMRSNGGLMYRRAIGLGTWFGWMAAILYVAAGGA